MQFVTLDVMGDQSYLWWHAAFNDYTIICNKTMLKEILQQFAPSSLGDEAEFGGAFSAQDGEMAHSLDLMPSVKCDDDIQVIWMHVVTLTKWGEFDRRTYTIGHSATDNIFWIRTMRISRGFCALGRYRSLQQSLK